MYSRSFLYLLFIILIPILSFAYPGKVLESYPAPGKFCTGMTFDGKNLWIADYKTDKLYMIDTKTEEIKRSISSPGFSFAPVASLTSPL